MDAWSNLGLNKSDWIGPNAIGRREMPPEPLDINIIDPAYNLNTGATYDNSVIGFDSMNTGGSNMNMPSWEDQLNDYHRNVFEPFQVDYRNRERKRQYAEAERNEIAETMKIQEMGRQIQQAGNAFSGAFSNLGNTMMDMSLDNDVFGWRV